MPTDLDRLQVLCQPETYAKVLTLVNVTGKTKSNIGHELVQHALKSEKYRALLEEADEAQTVKPKEDPRTESRRSSFHRQPSAAVAKEASASQLSEAELKVMEFFKAQSEKPGATTRKEAVDQARDEARETMEKTIEQQDERIKRMEQMMSQLLEAASKG